MLLHACGCYKCYVMFLLLIQVAKVQIEPGAGPPSPAQLKKLLLQQVISDSGAIE